MKLLQKEGTAVKNLPLLLMVAVGVLEFLFIILEAQFSGIGYYLAETYVIVPCLLFLGYMLQKKQTLFARRRLNLAVAAVTWFVIVQCIHKLSGMENHPMATVFMVYLMAFPFAVLSEDRNNAGLLWIGGIFAAASLVLVVYSALLILGLVPAEMGRYIRWDGARLNPLWHPNIAASYFMMGIGFCTAFCALARKTWAKVALIVLILIQLAAMALTNCRTTLLLTGALLGGTLFFLIVRKGGWKRFVLGFMVAGLLLVGSFQLAGKIFRWNNERLLASFSVSQEAEPVAQEEFTGEAEPVVQEEFTGEAEPVAQEEFAGEAEPVAQEEFTQETEPVAKELFIQEDTGVLTGDNEQKGLAEDMRTLNGRTLIWKAALSAIRDNKRLALWGTEYVGTVISAYNRFPVLHSHNSWMETQLRMGVPGLGMALIFTLLSSWSAAKLLLAPTTELWKKIVAMLAMCVMVSGFLEPYLFIANVYYHVTDFMFFFLTGYLDFWANFKQNT